MNNSEKSINNFHLIIFSNSPGEISAWVLPFVQTFKSLKKNSIVSVLLTPCDYATGNEYDLLVTHQDIDYVVKPKDTMKYVFFRQRFKKQAKNGAILFLGGDPLYPQLLKLRLSYPVYGYTEGKKHLGLLYRKTFFKHKDGDLMTSKIDQTTFDFDHILQKYSLDHKEYCLFMPGSRPAHFSLFMPLIIDTIKYIKKNDPQFEAIIMLSSFIKDVDSIQFKSEAEAAGAIVVEGNSLELMYVSKMMVSLPGTNTAEALYTLLPVLMVLPLNNPEKFVVDGLLQLLFKIPLLGSLLRKLAVKLFLLKKPMLALPNLIAKKQITPELIQFFTPQQLGDAVLSLFKDDQSLARIKGEFKRLKFKSKVDFDIAHYILNDVNIID